MLSFILSDRGSPGSVGILAHCCVDQLTDRLDLLHGVLRNWTVNSYSTADTHGSVVMSCWCHSLVVSCVSVCMPHLLSLAIKTSLKLVLVRLLACDGWRNPKNQRLFGTHARGVLLDRLATLLTSLGLSQHVKRPSIVRSNSSMHGMTLCYYYYYYAAGNAPYVSLIQEAQLPQRNSASAAHTCAADALFLCGSCIGIGTCRS